MNFSLYCFNEEMPLCLGCNSAVAAAADAALDEEDGSTKSRKHLKSAHDGHFVKSIKEVLRQAQIDKAKLRNEITEQENKIAAAMNYFSGLQEIFVEQRDLFIKKVNADFEVLTKMIERKRTEMHMKIRETYDLQISKTNLFREGL